MTTLGAYLAVLTAVVGFFFWPAWILTVGGIVLYAAGKHQDRQRTPEEWAEIRKGRNHTMLITLGLFVIAVLAIYTFFAY